MPAFWQKDSVKRVNLYSRVRKSFSPLSCINPHLRPISSLYCPPCCI
jgi:hypothetical protein